MTSEVPYGVPVDVGGDLGLAVRLVLDETCPSDILIDAATTALVEGLDSPALRELAGLPKRDAPYDARRLADRALEELGLTVAESSAASRAAARSWARALLDDRARPFVAGRAIWKCFTSSGSQLPDLAAEFLSLEDEWEGGWGRTESEIAHEVHRAATRLLDAWGDPLDRAQRFHSALRRELLRRYAYWSTIYSHGAPWDLTAVAGRSTTDRPEDVFPRYRILETLLIEVERINPSRLSLEDLRSRIAECATTQTVHEWVSYSAADDELQSVERWITDIDPLGASPLLLPYRRTLSERETSFHRSELAFRWIGDDDCWYPMTSSPVPDDVLIVDSSLWLVESAVDALRAALLDDGVTILVCLNELRPSVEMATEIFDPGFSSDGEIVAVPLAGSFIMYTSHEGTTAFSPGPHVERFRSMVPDFERWIWRGWQ